MKITSLVLIGILISSTILSQGSLNEYNFEKTPLIEEYIQNHHGIYFLTDPLYPDDNYNISELTDMAKEINTSIVKTVIWGNQPGEIVDNATNRFTQKILESFSTIHLTIAPLYLATLNPEEYHETHSSHVREDFRNLASYLTSNYNGSNKTIIIGGWGECNLYFGFPNSLSPDFPLKTFIEDFTSGVEQGIADAGGLNELKILTYLEWANHPCKDFWKYVKKYSIAAPVDLFGITIYSFPPQYPVNNEIYHRITWLKQFVNDSKIFGNDNICLGEYGITREQLPTEYERVNYFSEAITQCMDANVPYAYFFTLADQESKVVHEGSYGLIGLKSNGLPKTGSYHFFKNAYETNLTLPKPDLIVKDILWSPENPTKNESISFSSTILNQGNQDLTDGFKVEFFQNNESIGQSFYQQLSAQETVRIYCPNQTMIHKAKNTISVSIHTDVEEITKINNKKYHTLYVSDNPDLVITDIWWEPNQPKTNDSITFYAMVKNQGNMICPSGFGIGFYPDGYKDSLDWAFTSKSLNPGEEMVFTSNNKFWKPSFKGDHYIRALIDDNFVVNETREDNNHFYECFEITKNSKDTPITRFLDFLTSLYLRVLALIHEENL